MSHVEIIDNWRSYNGPCGLCGYWDQRHRMIECIRGRVKGGEKIPDLSKEYQISSEVIEAMMSCRIDKRRYKEALKQALKQWAARGYSVWGSEEMKTLAVLAFLLLTSAGCVTPSTMLVNSQGQAMRCASTGYGYGIAGAIAIGTAEQSHDRCVQDLHKIGYIRIPDVRVGLKSDWKLTPPVITAVEGPAEQIGLKVGDKVLSLDGKVYSSEYDVYKLLNTKKRGDTIKVRVRREEQVLDFAPVLTAR